MSFLCGWLSERAAQEKSQLRFLLNELLELARNRCGPELNQSNILSVSLKWQKSQITFDVYLRLAGNSSFFVLDKENTHICRIIFASSLVNNMAPVCEFFVF